MGKHFAEAFVEAGEIRGIKVYFNPDPDCGIRRLATLGPPVRLEPLAIPSDPTRDGKPRWNWTLVPEGRRDRRYSCQFSGYSDSGDPDSEAGRSYAARAAEYSPYRSVRWLYTRYDGDGLTGELKSDDICSLQGTEYEAPDLGLVGVEEGRAILEALDVLEAPKHETWARRDAEREARAARHREATEARELALEMARRVPAGTRKEDFLPFVTATLRHLGFAQEDALGHDEAAASFAIAGQQLPYLADFRRLAGRDFDPTSDRVSRADVEVLPITPPEPPRPVVYECLECGATFDRPDRIEAGGMGCVRCN